MVRRKKSDQANATGTVVVLTGAMEVSTARHLQKDLSNALDTGGMLRLDARQVERADASALQLLYACVQAATTRGMTCTWEGASEALCTAADLCGLRDSLGLSGQTS